MTPDPYSPASIAREDERHERCATRDGTGDCPECDGAGTATCDGLCPACGGTGRVA